MSDRPLVIVTRGLPEGWLDALARDCELVVGPADRAGWCDETWSRLPEARGIFAMLTERIDREVLDRAPKLEVVSNMAVGVDNIDVAACRARGIAVGHTPGVLTEATADLTFALILAWSRRVVEAAADAREGRWTTWSPTGWLGRDLGGARLGLVGFGKIARAVCRRAQGFGMHVVYSRRSSGVDHPGAKRVELDALLSGSDIVSIHVPLSDATHGMIGKGALARMRADALLVNTSRGPIVERQALLDALVHGRIGGAALDVTDPEPLPPDDPLYRLPNVLVLPHIGSATVGTRRAMAQLACDNLLAGLAGTALPHAVAEP
ncbi:MAG: D-glycerate dehydrogenase [Deltaproteobacteria bacterium]|nr:D-glycerate dehydrogenase [Nannocystaceae bacterium]